MYSVGFSGSMGVVCLSGLPTNREGVQSGIAGAFFGLGWRSLGWGFRHRLLLGMDGVYITVTALLASNCGFVLTMISSLLAGSSRRRTISSLESAVLLGVSLAVAILYRRRVECGRLLSFQ